jgi:hypothetical protein
MLVVKIEMWPQGDHTKARSIGVATIANTGGDTTLGDYECRLFKSPENSKKARPLHEMLTRPKAKETWRKGTVQGFPRIKLGPWDLLFRALGALVSDKNTGVEFNADVRGDSFSCLDHTQHLRGVEEP